MIEEVSNSDRVANPVRVVSTGTACGVWERDRKQFR